MNDMDVWRRELIDEVRTIANHQMLERLWLGEDPHEVSSYLEEVAHIFDDYDINGFLLRSTDETRLTPQQFAALRRFRDEMAHYVSQIKNEYSNAPDNEFVLSDPRWKNVMKLAQDFMGAIENP